MRSILLSVLLLTSCKTPPTPLEQGLLDCEAAGIKAQLPALMQQVTNIFTTGQVDTAVALNSLLAAQGPAVVCAVQLLVHDLTGKTGDVDRATLVKAAAWLNSNGHSALVKPNLMGARQHPGPRQPWTLGKPN